MNDRDGWEAVVQTIAGVWKIAIQPATAKATSATLKTLKLDGSIFRKGGSQRIGLGEAQYPTSMNSTQFTKISGNIGTAGATKGRIPNTNDIASDAAAAIFSGE